MDTSEIYIKMCDCPEIQDYEPVMEGNPHNLYSLNGQVVCLPWSDKPSGAIYLPDQDDLDGMARRPERDDEVIESDQELLERLWQWFEDSCLYVPEMDSMKKLKLAFVMHELHSKVWDGEKWESIESK